MEPSDIFSFVFDYKGDVFFIDLKRELLKDGVHWYFNSNKNPLNDIQLQCLRDAMKVYAYKGFSVCESVMRLNESINVYIEFYGENGDDTLVGETE